MLFDVLVGLTYAEYFGERSECGKNFCSKLAEIASFGVCEILAKRKLTSSRYVRDQALCSQLLQRGSTFCLVRGVTHLD